MRPVLLLITLLTAAAPAMAQPADPGEAAYQEGRRLYDLQEWDRAIAKFKEAYQLRSDAASLFNIAQSYRLKGDCVDAEAFYKTYKRNFPAAPNIAKVDKFIADLDACATAATNGSEPLDQTKPPDTVKPVTEPVKPVTEPVKPTTEPTKPIAIQATDDPGHGKRLAGIALGATGVVAVGVGIYFGLQARSKANDASSGSMQWDPAIQNDGERANKRAEIFFGVGGAALVAGGVLYWLGHRSSRETNVSVVPRRDGAMMVWACDL